MKLRIKKTGEVLEDVKYIDTTLSTITIQYLDDGVLRECSIKNLSDIEEVKDYEEPKDFWYIDDFAVMCGTEGEFTTPDLGSFTKEDIERLKAIGNYFETKAEAEKAVEKLKAWKRLKDKGFKFNGVTPMEYFIRFTYDKPRQILDNQQYPEVAQQFNKDLDLLFGGDNE